MYHQLETLARYGWPALLVLGLLLAPLPAPTPAAPTPAPTARLAPDQASAVALNRLDHAANGYRLTHPAHTAAFTPAGVEFAPQAGGPAWAWRMTTVAASGASLAGVTTGSVNPVRDTSLTVSYPRGGLVEQYVAKRATIEQQFLIPSPLTLAGADLVIAGAVQCPGAFEETADGWRWRTDDGAVYLGHVRVYDAAGRALPATMQATATATRITVDGAALAQAAYPVLIDPEIGANDFRLSTMGDDGNTNYNALNPAVAYNSTNNQYLVVWQGNDDLTNGCEIWGQRVDAVYGDQLGADFRISYMGSDGDTTLEGFYPDVAYNSANNEYLVVWSGDHYADGDQEIWGRRVNAATGALVGSQVRISVMGATADYDGYNPAVAYNSTANQYLVVWNGDHDSDGLVDGEYEIWGLLLDAGLEQIGSQFRISDMGGTGNASYDAQFPDVAYNSTYNEYLVVWEGDDTYSGLVDNELEIWGQRITAAGTAAGYSDFRISSMGTDGDDDYDANDPAVAYNSADNEYLVVWSGADDLGPTAYDIFGQRLKGTGASEGEDDFYVSKSGNGPNSNYDAYNPGVAYDPATTSYLVVWQDDELGADEVEIFGQQIAGGTGDEIEANVRLSDMGPNGDTYRDAQTPAVAFSSQSNNQGLIVWQGDNSTDGEFEIWAQRFRNIYKLYLPLILRNF